MWRSSNLFLKVIKPAATFNWKLHTSTALQETHKYKLVVVGGGSGGCSTAAKFASKLGKNHVAVIEPADNHYYQPMWTLVGGGMKNLASSGRPMGSVLPRKAVWIHERAVSFDPDNNTVTTNTGKDVMYDYLVVAMGLQLNYDKVIGLTDALETPGVCSNYSPLHVEKTFKALQNTKEGNAIFTFPNTPVKCAGAPQKIMYISEHYFRNKGLEKNINIMYNTSLGVLFGVKKYADALWKIVKDRNIAVKLRYELISVNADRKEATFLDLDKIEHTITIPYTMLHAVPPMSAPNDLKRCKELTDSAGYLEVNKDTLQHVRYPNIFGIGDCTNLPTAKTAAAVAAQIGILSHNLKMVMAGNSSNYVYDGYTSCPLVTGYGTCVLAEFDYKAQPLETFPFNQAKERYSMFALKSYVMPEIYWNMMLRGYWEGPGKMRKIINPSFKSNYLARMVKK